MKNRKHYYSLRLKITLIVGTILILSTLSLTIASILNANNSINYAIGTTELVPGDGLPDDAIEVPGNGDNVEIIVRSSGTLQREFAFSSILTMVLISSVGMGATYLTIKRVTKPLSDLNGVMSRINSNNLNQKVSGFDTKDEVNELATTFNSMLEKLSESFSAQRNFASSAAHEFKTPLATMKASLQFLKLDENITREDYEKNALIMESCTQRLISTVENLFCMVSNDTIEQNDEIHLSETFEDIRKDLSVLALEKDISIEINPSDVYIYGNKTLLSRAIYNLVENAIKYSNKKGLVTLSAFETNETVSIQVEDKGLGIPLLEQAHIFEPFYRVDQSRSQAIEGSGLGLAIVKSIIEKHHGHINVSSESGKGATFIISLPQTKKRN